MVVDDEPDLRDSIAEILEMKGYAVATAANGREALDLAVSGPPSIILLDLGMPVMSGWEVISAMRQDERLRSVPVIVISAEAHPPADVPVIRKPFHPEHLLDVMHRVLKENCP